MGKNMTAIIGASAGVVIVLILGIVLIQGQMKQANRLQEEIGGLDQEISAQSAIAGRRADAEKKKEQIAKTFDKFVSLFPKKENADRVFDVLQLYSQQSKIDVKRIGIVEVTPSDKDRGGAPAPAATRGPQDKNFGTRDNTIEVEGTFFDFVEFLNRLESHKEFLQVDSFTIVPKRDAAPKPGARGDMRFTVTMKLRTFFYDPKA